MTGKSKAAIETIKTDLEINEHIRLHKIGWKFQVAGLIFIFLMVTLAALGFFGNGVLSSKKDTGNNSQIQYERFFRHEAIMELPIQVEGSAGNCTVAFDAGYLKAFKIESIVPEPASQHIRNGQIQYIFEINGKAQITFYLIPQSVGSFNTAVSVNSDRYQISQFIFP